MLGPLIPTPDLHPLCLGSDGNQPPKSPFSVEVFPPGSPVPSDWPPSVTSGTDVPICGRHSDLSVSMPELRLAAADMKKAPLKCSQLPGVLGEGALGHALLWPLEGMTMTANWGASRADIYSLTDQRSQGNGVSGATLLEGRVLPAPGGCWHPWLVVASLWPLRPAPSNLSVPPTSGPVLCASKTPPPPSAGHLWLPRGFLDIPGQSPTSRS